MITKEVVINNQVGLHARPATFFIQKEEDAIATLSALIDSDFSE